MYILDLGPLALRLAAINTYLEIHEWHFTQNLGYFCQSIHSGLSPRVKLSDQEKMQLI